MVREGTNDRSGGLPGPEAGDERPGADRQQRLRNRNLALLAVLIGLVALFYVITIVRMGGGH